MLYIKRGNDNTRSLTFTKNRRGESQQNLEFTLEKGEMVYKIETNKMEVKGNPTLNELVDHPITKIIGRSLVTLLSKQINKKMKKH